MSGQHTELSEHFRAFRLTPDVNLDSPPMGVSLTQRTAWMIRTVGHLLKYNDDKPSSVVVQGDTSTVFAAALAAFMEGIPVVHVEAGLRTWDLASPFPEEGFRQMVSRIATVNYAPTNEAAVNLQNEGVPAINTVIVGNTAIDALHTVQAVWPHDPKLNSEDLNEASKRKFVLVTCHRRENLGEPAQRLANYIKLLAATGVSGVVIRHPNPEAALPFMVDASPKFVSVKPIPYAQMVALLKRADVVITDSGGLVEEATHLGKPVVIYRNTTERQEAVAAGAARMAFTKSDVDSHVTMALNGSWVPPAKARGTFGDGFASSLIVKDMLERELV